MNNKSKVKEHFDIANYSRERWKTHSESSDNLIPFLKSKNPNLVLDIGCGTNPYKEHVPNVIGIDIGNYKEADINLSIEEVYDLNIFQDGCADIVLALGSINFGDYEDVKRQLEICINLCKPGGHLILRARLNDHTELMRKKGFVQFGWQVEDVFRFTELFKSKVEIFKEPVIETAAGGSFGDKYTHGLPDHSRKINLVVWYWSKI